MPVYKQGVEDSIKSSLLTTIGDIIAASAVSTPARIAAPASGQVLTGQGAGVLPAWAAGGAVTRAGGNTTEATTTSTSAVDLLTISSLTIVSSTHVRVLLVMRKTSGAAAAANTGLKLNTVAVAGINQWTNGNNAARDGYAKIDFLAGGVANYTNAGFFQVSDVVGNGISGIWFGTAAIPAATITDIVLRASVGSASITQAHDEMHAYTYAVS